jgi:Tol biopolymer transport system component
MSRKIYKIIAALSLVLFLLILPSCGANSQNVSVQVLPALKQAGLQGRIFFILYEPQDIHLVQLDLSSGAMKTLFAAPKSSWLATAVVSPDGKTILLAYAPPPPAGQVQLANTDLYRMPADGSSAPQPLLKRTVPGESYSYPAWAADGQTIYTTHSLPSNTTQLGIDSNIERFKPGEAPQVIVKNAIWSQPSPDGARLAYLALSEFTSNNSLYLANADGSSPKELVSTQQFPIVDEHIFSPDGQQVYFSAPDAQAQSPAPGGWVWDFGVRPVSAHNNPSDWFRVSVQGGQAQQVTQVKGVNMSAAFSPDQQWLAFASEKGLFVMRPDGSQLTQVVDQFGMWSIQWLQ